jgi:hypothetical protein
MQSGAKLLSACLGLGFAAVACSTVAQAQQPVRQLALKNGESVDIGTFYFVLNCRSILTALPMAELLEGPPQLSVAVTEAMIVPRAEQCPNEVKGGRVTLSAKDVTQRSEAQITIRLKFPTKDGERQGSRQYKVTLFP